MSYHVGLRYPRSDLRTDMCIGVYTYTRIIFRISDYAEYADKRGFVRITETAGDVVCVFAQTGKFVGQRGARCVPATLSEVALLAPTYEDLLQRSGQGAWVRLVVIC